MLSFALAKERKGKAPIASGPLAGTIAACGNMMESIFISMIQHRRKLQEPKELMMKCLMHAKHLYAYGANEYWGDIIA